MSSILWWNKGLFHYTKYLTTWPFGGGVQLSRLGTSDEIVDFLKGYCFSQSFSQKDIKKNPAKWGAYFIYLGKRHLVSKALQDLDFDVSEQLLIEIFENVEPNIWVNNSEIVQKLCVSLIQHSMNLK